MHSRKPLDDGACRDYQYAEGKSQDSALKVAAAANADSHTLPVQVLFCGLLLV